MTLAEFPEIEVVIVNEIGGLPAAIASATKPWLLLVDPCRGYGPAHLKAMTDAVAKFDDVDLLVGQRQRAVPGWLRLLDVGKRAASRVLLGAAPAPRTAWLGGRGALRRFLYRQGFGVRLPDLESGLILAKRSVFAQLALQARGPFVWTEILAKANHLGKMIAEVPIADPGGEGSGSTFRDAVSVFRTPTFHWPPRQFS